MERLPIVVYSHLRWSSVYQRPHQILSRISARRPVLFLEETVAADPLAPDSAELQYPLPNLLVVRPILQNPSGPFDPERLGVLGKRLLRWQRRRFMLIGGLGHQLVPHVIAAGLAFIRTSAFANRAPSIWTFMP